MSKWTLINIDKDDTGRITLGHTSVLKVPGGVVIRTIVQDHGHSTVFVPNPIPVKRKPSEMISGEDMINIWIEANKIDK